MKKFCVHLNTEKLVNLIEVEGASGQYETSKDEKYYIDFVIRDADGAEKVRIDREHILYITTSETSNS